MSDFDSAIRAGIESAKSADIASREIGEIFSVLDKDVKNATAGKVGAHLEVNLFTNTLAALAKSQPAGNQIFTLSLISTSDKSKNSQVATISKTSNGYPVQVVYGNTSVLAKDAVGLKSAISNIFMAPETGRALLSLSSLPVLTRPSVAQSPAAPSKPKNVLKRPG
jgi:hypothetical protein